MGNGRVEARESRHRANASGHWPLNECSRIQSEGTAIQGCRFTNYSTFAVSSRRKNEPLPCWWRAISKLIDLSAPRRRLPLTTKKDSLLRTARRHIWTLILAVFLSLVLCQLHPFSSTLENSYQAPTWKWYKYHYVPKPINGDGSNASQKSSPGVRNLLIAQIAGTGPLSDIADITSRPNRAYTKQWRIDFLRYFGGQGLARECFNKMFVLDTLMEQQESKVKKKVDKNLHRLSKTKYDAVLFLPADSIITDLDFDLLALLPEEKLVAIAGSSGKGSNLEDFRMSESGIIMWNLNHEHARTVSKLWLDFIQHPWFTCRDANDIGFLLMALESTLSPEDKKEDLSDLIQPLQETANGFVSPRVIKFVRSSTSASEPRMNHLVRNLFETTATLETTSDSVCYRYYPRCEVL